MNDPAVNRPQPKHKVEFSVEDGCIWILNVKCISSKGASCLTGCPERRCEDWSHGPDGCEHCQNDCERETTPIEDFCPVEREHGGECPYVFTDIDCWVTHWIVECDPHDWFREIVREHVVDPAEDEHPERIYEIVSNGWVNTSEYVDDNVFELNEFDFFTLKEIKWNHPDMTIAPKRAGKKGHTGDAGKVNGKHQNDRPTNWED
jgi:hypothetical protein